MINLFLLSLFLIFNESTAQPHTTLVAPLNKDTATSLYTILLNSGDRYVVDIAAPFSWRRCPSRGHPTVACFTTECFQATYLPSPCPPPPTSSKTPCKCIVSPQNPITQSCAFDQLTSINLTLSWAPSGANPTADIASTYIYLSCAPKSLFQSLPRGVVGLSSLSLAPLSLPSQLSDRFPRLSRKFAMCLPSSSSRNGVIFFGNASYDLDPRMELDASSLLSYTPLLTNPKSAAYGIGIKALSIGPNSIPMSPFEAIGLSTVVPYTTLVTDVFKVFVEFFAEAMKGVPRVKSVKPFTTCYKASAIGFDRVGFHVPQIDLEFDNGKNWTIFGANSMVGVGGDTACLAFLDGGTTAELKIVIGAFQMQDNLLVFDLDQLRFGFSSSLLFERMTCSNFNFTKGEAIEDENAMHGPYYGIYLIDLV
ncbi:hypothetical protein C2S51_021300 [Perilla frutescens var. frutescens]|nr:hypothetical protein C2S51_021300 [Perilla frutescens var. frutescens]